MISRREYLQQVACAFACAGIGCAIPALAAESAAPPAGRPTVWIVGTTEPFTCTATVQQREIADGVDVIHHGDWLVDVGQGVRPLALFDFKPRLEIIPVGFAAHNWTRGA